jgi:hypothetical protein
MLDPDFAEREYRYQLQRRHDLLNSVSLPVAVLTALGSLLVVVATGFSYRGRVTIPFVCALAIAAILFALSVTSLLRAYLGATHRFIPELGSIASFKDDLETFYVGLGYPPEHAMPDFGEQLTQWYVTATDYNRAINNRVSAHLMRAAQGITGVLIALAVCGILYVVDALRLL